MAGKPIIFNFHAYPWLIHRLAYRRTNHRNLHVRGYKEKGSINPPLELPIQNQVDRFSIAIDVIDRVPRLKNAGVHAKESLNDQQIQCREYAEVMQLRQSRVSASGTVRNFVQKWIFRPAGWGILHRPLTSPLAALG